MQTCDRCPLAIENNFTMVKPRGNINSKLFFIGEAPGHKEKKLGYTFVGKAGILLQSFIDEYNLNNHCYLTNAIKCRPPRNRTPFMSELDACKPHLIREFRDGKPKIIVLLGNTAINSFFGKEINGVSKLNNKFLIYKKQVIIFAYHPSYIARNPELEYEYHKLFKKIRVLYRYLINKYI